MSLKLYLKKATMSIHKIQKRNNVKHRKLNPFISSMIFVLQAGPPKS